MNSLLYRRIIIAAFVTVPLLSSLISTIHLIDMFTLGNPSWISYVLSITIEIGAISSFLALSVLEKLNKSIVWSVFIILFLMQIIGNVYYSYSWMTDKLLIDSNWLKNFKEMINFFIDMDQNSIKMLLACIIGIPIPTMSVFLLKSTMDYMTIEKNNSEPQINSIEETDEEIQARKRATPAHI